MGEVEEVGGAGAEEAVVAERGPDSARGALEDEKVARVGIPVLRVGAEQGGAPGSPAVAPQQHPMQGRRRKTSQGPKAKSFVMAGEGEVEKLSSCGA